MMGGLIALASALAGVAQASSLARTARGQPGILSFFARVLLVGAVLWLAARSGHLAFGTLGWMAGFAGTGALLHRRLR